MFGVATLGQDDLPSVTQGPSSRTIAEVFAAAPNVPEEQAPSLLLGHALLAVQQVQRAYARMNDKPHRLVTRGTLPPIIPARVAALPPVNPDDSVTTRLIDPAESRMAFVRIDGQPSDPTPHGLTLNGEELEKLSAYVDARLAYVPLPHQPAAAGVANVLHSTRMPTVGPRTVGDLPGLTTHSYESSAQTLDPTTRRGRGRQR